MLPDGFELFSSCRCKVAEGPRWNDSDQRLYWVDISLGAVYRREKNAPPDVYESFSPGIGKIGAIVFHEGKLLLFAANCRIYRCSFGEKAELFAKLPGHQDTRFNDVFADRAGHIFCGVAWNPETKKPGELWRFSLKDKTFRQIESDLSGMPNGMGVSPDRKKLYFAVSEEWKVYCYDFDEEAGTLKNRRIFAEFQPEGGNPDGLAVDPETGNVAVAFWNGRRLLICSPDGCGQKEFRFPIAKVTSAEYAPFGLIVTTANLPWEESEWEKNHAGSVFVYPFRNDR